MVCSKLQIHLLTRIYLLSGNWAFHLRPRLQSMQAIDAIICSYVFLRWCASRRTATEL